MVVDASLGEIFGPFTLGNWDPPGPPRRPLQEALDLVRGLGCSVPSLLLDRIAGEHPTWPEGVEQARLRFCRRTGEYLERSSLLHTGILVVTHADCVAAVLSMLLRNGSRSYR